jgi:hypothetical protein
LLKGLAEDMMPRGGGSNSYLFLSEGRSNGTSHHFQAPFDDHPEMK